MIWFEGGGVALAFFISAPPVGGGDRLRFDIFRGRGGYSRSSSQWTAIAVTKMARPTFGKHGQTLFTKYQLERRNDLNKGQVAQGTVWGYGGIELRP